MTVMHRSAIESWRSALGLPTVPLPPDLAYVIQEHAGAPRKIVTWADVMQQRRERQRQRLEVKRAGRPVWRAYKLWVAYFDQNLMGGWQCMIEDFRGRYSPDSHWIDRDMSWMQPHLMELFPLVPATGTEREQWQRWKPAFAKEFKRRTQYRRPLGVTYVWWNRRDSWVLPSAFRTSSSAAPFATTC